MLVISLGCNCHVRKSLKQFMNRESLPFDWIFSSLQTVHDVLFTDKDVLFDRKNIIAKQGSHVVRLKSTFFKSVHDIPVVSAIHDTPTTFENGLRKMFIEKYKRRHERFLDHLSNSKEPIAFVHVPGRTLSFSLMCTVIEKLKELIGKPFLFITLIEKEEEKLDIPEVQFVVGAPNTWKTVIDNLKEFES